MLSTEQVKIIFVGTLPEFYTPDRQQRADEFETWLADYKLKVRAETLREAAKIADDARFDGDGDMRQVRDQILSQIEGS